nr:MAG TPA: hypothetical protein [Caudoviricetes sp.]
MWIWFLESKNNHVVGLCRLNIITLNYKNSRLV